ncbi:GNAT family N-acetyltransferase, partial [Salmonella enterica subsp. enterica]|nr:GNAT family N-acetyltransferase [Salmonella enterica subsp. enterica serovar Abony]
MLTVTPAKPAYFPRLVAIWESSVRATHDFLGDADIEKLRPLLLNTYLPNLNVVVAQ